MKITVYGASGYQGRLVLAELARRGIEPILAGRDPARLTQAAEATGLHGAQRRQAAAGDHRALARAFTGSDAVINCAGPFTFTARAVAAAAIDAGCHYVDTCGEQLAIKDLFDTLASRARGAGVSVVPAATDGCVLLDLLASLVAARLDRIGEMRTVHLIGPGGGVSRGTLRSLAATIETVRSGGLVYDGGLWRPASPGRRGEVRLPGREEVLPVAGFAVPEVVTIPRHVRLARLEGLAEAGLGERLGDAPPPEVIASLPEGPAERERRAQRFTYLAEAAGTDGRRVRGVVEGSDTYGLTAAIAVESARRLVAEPAKAGVLAPAQAFDPSAFLDFLGAYGVRWAIEGGPGR
jgi:short subunit dehydrogenase-like uncharacterized protein